MDLRDDVVFYNKNVLRELAQWNILTNANAEVGKITIGPNGAAGIQITNEYMDGLKASTHRKLTLKIKTEQDDEYNYVNYVDFLLTGQYLIAEDINGKQLKNEYISVNFTKRASQDLGNGIIGITRIIDVEDYNFNSLLAYIRNSSGSAIEVVGCSLQRSQDISSAQVGESIDWSVTLDKLVAYENGCELFYSGLSTPDKLWWIADDDGNFAGVNVNNEKIIKFSRSAGSLEGNGIGTLGS